MVVSIHWGSCLAVLKAGALLFGVYIETPDFKNSQMAPNRPTKCPITWPSLHFRGLQIPVEGTINIDIEAMLRVDIDIQKKIFTYEHTYIHLFIYISIHKYTYDHLYVRTYVFVFLFILLPEGSALAVPEMLTTS